MIVYNLKTPYYAVIFSTIVTDNLWGYSKTANRMEELAKFQKRLFRYRICDK